VHLPGPSPHVTTFQPSKGAPGDKLWVNLRARYDILNLPYLLAFAIMFGDKRCETTLTGLAQTDGFYNYALTTDIPSRGLDHQLTLQVKMEDAYGRELDVFEVGDFTYVDLSPYPSYNPSHDVPRKRRYSGESEDTPDYMRHAAKRMSSQRLYAKPRASSGSYVTGHGSPSPATSYVQPSLSSGLYSSGYERVQPQQSQQSHSYIPPGGLGYQQNIKSQSPRMPTYSPYSTVSQTRPSPASLAASPARASAMPAPSNLANPQLIRTSTIQQAPGNRVVPTVSHTHDFNPYHLYPNSKAALKIEGDLEKMSEEWTQDELDAKRRLVQFRRSQTGSTIHTSFEPVSPEQRSPNSICVSCILWEEKSECYITSVDTIFLLESLVGVRFTVEEKNRIRRNLEGFRPATVSKTKVDSEEFFKVIMGFPNPKPRNIEKDVKVFPWKILAHALKKIISKYVSAALLCFGDDAANASQSASYSSTAGALESNDGPRNTSPHSVASSSGSLAYTSALPMSKMSPKSKGSAGLEGSGGLPELHVSVPQLAPSLQGLSWPATAHLPVVHAAPNLAGAFSTGRSAWEYGGGYLESPASAPLPSTQSLQLQRPGSAPDAGEAAGSETYQGYGQRTSHA
jgi:hypothetical protein